MVGEELELLAMLFDVEDSETSGRLLLRKLRRLFLPDPVGHLRPNIRGDHFLVGSCSPAAADTP